MKIRILVMVMQKSFKVDSNSKMAAIGKGGLIWWHKQVEWSPKGVRIMYAIAK